MSSEFFAGYSRFVTLGAAAALAAAGCNALVGIEKPIDPPLDAAQGSDFDAREGSPGETGAIDSGWDAGADAESIEPDGDASPSRCTEKPETYHDPNTGNVWTPVWYCGNRGRATVYETASSMTPIGTMRSNTSWFVCYRHGELHGGGNDVWYYTQGDDPLPGWESRLVWGYMPAVDVYTSTDPFPGIVECTANP
jgi:hypothetical protein